MNSPGSLEKLRPRPPPWGPLGGVRRLLAGTLAGPAAEAPAAAAYRCTILKVDRLGDFILATGAIRTLVAHFGAARCALVVSAEAEALAAREFPDVRRVVLPAFPHRLLRDLAPKIRAWRAALAPLSCEQLVCLRHQRSLYRDLLLRAIPARRRWWLDAAPFGDEAVLALEQPAARYPGESASGLARETSAHRALLGAVLQRSVAEEEILPRLAPPAPAGSDPAVVIAPFASDPIRDLDAARIWRVLAAEPGLAGAPLRLLGSDGQKARLEAFRRQAPPELAARCSVVAGEPADRWLVLLGGARLVVGCESAIAHAAAALDRPLVALLGGGHPGLFAPWGRSRRQHWLTHAEPCYGCDWHCPHPEPFCLTRISDDALARAVRAALEDGNA